MSSVSPMSVSSSSSKDIVADIVAAANVSKRSKKEKKTSEKPVEEKPVEDKPKKSKKTTKKTDEEIKKDIEPPTEDKPKKSKKTSKKTDDKHVEENARVAHYDTEEDVAKEVVVVEESAAKEVVANVVEESAANTTQLNKKTVAELKALCKSRDIKVSSKAKKEEIIKALMAEPEQHTVLIKEAAVSDVDYSKMTVAELKDLCKERNIHVQSKIKKDELIAKLNRRKTPILEDSPCMEVVSQDVAVVQEQETVVEEACVNYNKMTVAELKSLCKERNLKVDSKAKKADMIALLEQSENANASDPETKPASNAAVMDYSKMNVSELKSKCKEQNIKHDSKAKKADLIALLEPVVKIPALVSETETAPSDGDNGGDGDDEYVEKQTVLFEYDGEKYWMDTEESTKGIHDIYSYDSLDHIGYYDKSKNTIMHIDE